MSGIGHRVKYFSTGVTTNTRNMRNNNNNSNNNNNNIVFVTAFLCICFYSMAVDGIDGCRRAVMESGRKGSAQE